MRKTTKAAAVVATFVIFTAGFSTIAQAAPKPCSSCAFFVPISGSLRASFGVCANAISPEDARVVSVDHGCGAHSEATL